MCQPVCGSVHLGITHRDVAAHERRALRRCGRLTLDQLMQAGIAAEGCIRRIQIVNEPVLFVFGNYCEVGDSAYAPADRMIEDPSERFCQLFDGGTRQPPRIELR